MTLAVISFLLTLLGIIATYYYAKLYSLKSSITVFTTGTSEIIRSKNAKENSINYSVKGDADLGDIYKSQVFVGNTGNVDIQENAVIKPLSLALGEGTKILKITQFSSEGIDFSVNAASNNLVFAWDLIKQGEFIGCEVLVSSLNSSGFKVNSFDSRIANLNNVVIHEIKSENLYSGEAFKKKKRSQFWRKMQVIFFSLMVPFIVWSSFYTMKIPNRTIEYKVTNLETNENVNIYALSDSLLVEGYVTNERNDTFNLSTFNSRYRITPTVEHEPMFYLLNFKNIFTVFAIFVIFFSLVPPYLEERSKIKVIKIFRNYYPV